MNTQQVGAAIQALLDRTERFVGKTLDILPPTMNVNVEGDPKRATLVIDLRIADDT